MTPLTGALLVLGACLALWALLMYYSEDDSDE